MSHVSAYISDPYTALQTIIDGGKDKVERIHAAIGIADWGLVTFAPHSGVASADLSGKSEFDLCDGIAAHLPQPSQGHAAIDWNTIWDNVRPFVFQLIQRWMFS